MIMCVSVYLELCKGIIRAIPMLKLPEFLYFSAIIQQKYRRRRDIARISIKIELQFSFAFTILRRNAIVCKTLVGNSEAQTTTNNQ